MAKYNANGKNSGKYSKKSGLSKKYMKKSSKKKSSSGSQKKIKIPITPPLPPERKMSKIQKKNRALLFSLEDIILKFSLDHTTIIDENVLRILAKLLWDFEEWSPYNESKSSKPIQSKPCIELNNFELKLFKSLKTYIQNSMNDKSPSIIKKHFNKSDIWDSLACIFDSVNFWHNNGGRKGYISYISNQMPDLPDFLKDTMIQTLLEDEIVNEINKADAIHEENQDKVKKYQKSHYSKKEIEGYAAISDSILFIMKIEEILSQKLELTLNKKEMILIEGYVKKIVKLLESAIKKLPEICEVYNPLIYAEIFLNKIDSAEQKYIKANDKFPEENEIKIAGGSLYFKLGMYQKSLEIFKELNDKHNEVYALFMMGCCYFNMKKFALAINCFKQIDSSDDNYPELDPLKKLCNMMENSDDLDEFEEYKADDMHFLIELIAKLQYIDTILFMSNKILQHELINSGFLKV